MNKTALSFAALAAFAAAAPAANPPEPGPGLPGSMPPSPVVEELAWGEDTLMQTIDTQTMLLRHTATLEQQRVAVKNAKAYMAALPPAKKAELVKKHIRFLAVPTVRSKETSPAAKEVVMIWDIQSDSLANKEAYEPTTQPTVGKLATFDNMEAEYIGSVASAGKAGGS